MRPTRRVVTLFVLTSLLSLGLVPVAFATEVDAPEVVDAALSLDGAADAGRTSALEAPIAFSSLWAELPDGIDAVRVRTSADGDTWTEWTELAAEDGDLDAPDPGTAEAAAAADRPRVSELLDTGEARIVQVEAVGGQVGDVVLRLADTAGLNESLVARVGRHLTARAVPAAEAATVPTWVNTRDSWGAAAYRGTPSISRRGVEQVVVHHTAGRNDLRRADGTCDRDQVASTIRGIQNYHQNGNGWSDIGYNVVIDPCGGVWEGRQGGLDRAIIGAHAAGANTGSTGVSVLGNYEGLTPNEDILRALDRVVGWKAGIHGIDTTGTVTRTINGTTRTYPTVVGHTNVGSTACPGRIMHSLARIRTNAKAEAGKWERVPDGTGLGTSSFTDTYGNTHAEAIEQLVEREITGGYPDGSFRPQLSVTRAQVATFLARLLELEPVPGVRFADVPEENVHGAAINALVDAGILSGYDADRFGPGEPLRREHMAVVLTRALELEPDPEAGATFPDVVAYAGEIGAIKVAEITTGRTDGTFLPKGSVTRGQMATFLMNAVRLLEERAAAETQPEPEPDPEPSEPAAP